MERTMSVEEKIKRAEEIYNRRRGEQSRSSSAKVTVNSKNEFRLFKKIIIQIIVCLAIYGVFYLIKNNNYIFSEDLTNKAKEVLSYDVNFSELYSKAVEILQNHGIIPKKENQTQEKTEEVQNEEQTIEESGIGGAEENNEEDLSGLSQMEQDAINIKKSISFINPIEGTVTSTFGLREPTTNTVPKYHTGLDIANSSGTKIYSATDGDVVLASSEGDYGNHLKVQIGDISIIYAHCKTLNVNEGDHIVQGQEIAEVGSTGNSTGPHLHFEIRKEDRFVDPQLILDI